MFEMEHYHISFSFNLVSGNKKMSSEVVERSHISRTYSSASIDSVLTTHKML